MLDEKLFQIEEYIQERLREIGDLDERRIAKEVLWDGLRRVFEMSEERYKSLEQRISNEIQIPSENYSIAMVVCKKESYSPVNDTFFPVCPDDLKKVSAVRLFLEADIQVCKQFMNKKHLIGKSKDGREITFQIKRDERYLNAVEKVYQLFSYNMIPWKTVHTGYFERFFELIPLNAGMEIIVDEICIEENEFSDYLRFNRIPLWNLKEITIESSDFMRPGSEGKYYEHVADLRHYSANSTYLISAREEIFELRYEDNKIYMKSRQETLEDLVALQISDGIPDSVDSYEYYIISNKKRGSFAGRYLHKTGNFLQTRLEMVRKVEELVNGKEMGNIEFEITDKIAETVMEADMNYFISASAFPKEHRKNLVFIFQKPEQVDFLYEDDIRYVLSQLQMEFLEYKCVGLVQ